jgi:hypothetical protein
MAENLYQLKPLIEVKGWNFVSMVREEKSYLELIFSGLL